MEMKKDKSNAEFLIETNEKTKNVKGTHINFDAENEQTEMKSRKLLLITVNTLILLFALFILRDSNWFSYSITALVIGIGVGVNVMSSIAILMTK